ncbi:hypothetical protein CLOP_g13563 [Closterium sp. NIES-67]|nr:hypothetical protein CLOP_g13563 [Closterium sp. NIES-67]
MASKSRIGFRLPDRNGIGVTVAAGVPDNGVGIETARVPTPNKLGVVRLGVGSTVAGGGVSTMGVVVCHSHSVQFVLRPTDGAILHASKGAVKTLGYSPDELLSTSLLRLAAPLPLNDWRAVVQRLETAQIDSAALPLTLTCPALPPPPFPPHHPLLPPPHPPLLPPPPWLLQRPRF